jgi:DNA-binding GntR family transcriptional regulator
MEKFERKRTTVQSEVADVLRDRIIRGRLKAGDRLRQDHIAEELSVSNIPVREALRELAAQGLITIEPHRGAIVSAVSLDEFEEITWLRALLEPQLLRLAIPRLGQSEISELRSILKSIDDLRSSRNWGRLNWKFHSAIYRHADRPQTFAIVERLHANVERFLQMEASVLHNIKTSQAEHYSILERIQRGDIQNAAKLLREHIEVDAHKAIAAFEDAARAR